MVLLQSTLAVYKSSLAAKLIIKRWYKDLCLVEKYISENCNYKFLKQLALVIWESRLETCAF